MNRKDKFQEILNPNQATALNASITGQVSRQTDRFCQSIILSLNKTGKVQVPKSNRHHLDIQIPYITLQLFISSFKTCFIEFTFFDCNKTRRKLILNNCRGICKNSIQSRLPLTRLPKECWINLCVDLNSLSLLCFGYSFDELDSILVAGSSKIRRIFACNSGNEGELPSGYQLPAFSSKILMNSAFFDDTCAILERKKGGDENRKEGKVVVLRGLSASNRSASNRSASNINSGRYCNGSFRKQLKPIEKADSFYENALNSLSGIGRNTPPFVHLNKEPLFYDPVSKAYVD